MADNITITDNAGTFEYHGWSTDLEGRIYPLSGYLASDGTKIPESSPFDNGQFYWSAYVTNTSGLLTLDDFVNVKPTLTAQDDPGARLGLFLFDRTTKRLVATLIESFSLSDDAVQDWEDVIVSDAGGATSTPLNKTIGGSLSVGGHVTATQFNGSGAGLTGILGAGAGGSSSTGSLSLIADSDNTNAGEVIDVMFGTGGSQTLVARFTRLIVNFFVALVGVFYDKGGQVYNAKAYGLKGDGTTDDTAAFQALINLIAGLGKSATIFFPEGVYIIGGALQDTSLSKAQIVLPKVSTLSPMLTVHLEGACPPPTPWNNDSGTILKSTLSSGTGVMIGVKNNQGSGVATASEYMSNASSNIYVALKNLTLQLPINPTNSALDLGHVRNFELRNVRIVTGDFASGGANPVVVSGTAIPDLAVTLPTTTTSYGVNLPTNLINNGNIDGLFSAGFYAAIRTGELAKGRNIVIHCSHIGFQVEGAIWPSRFENVTIAGTAYPIKATGAKPEQLGFSDTVNASTVFFDNVGIENDPVNPVVSVVDDPSDYLSGHLGVFYGAGAALPLNPAVPQIRITRAERPYNFTDPYTEIFTGFAAQDNAVLEINRRMGTSNSTKWAALLLSARQSGTSHLVGGVQWINEVLAGTEKRLGAIYLQTNGATNNGLMGLYVMNGGVLTLFASIDHNGHFNLASVPAYANNAAALAGGLVAGDFYRSGDALCIVH